MDKFPLSYAKIGTERENLNRSISMKEIKRAKILPPEKQQVQAILQWILPNFKEQLIPVLYKLFRKNRKQSKIDQDISWSWYNPDSKKSDNAKKMIGPFNITQKSYPNHYLSKSNSVF